MTIVLSAGDLRDALTVEDALDALRKGFGSSIPVAGQRHRTDLPFPGTATALLPGTLDGVPAFSIKANVKFPAANPALRGVVCIYAGTDGELLGILDSSTLTAWRTGLSAALATDLLARRDAKTVAVIGAGAQGTLTVRGLAHLRGRFDLIVHDVDEERARMLAQDHGGRVAGSVEEAASAADVVLVATWAREPVLIEFSPAGGQHITSLGSDEPGKHELAATLLQQCLLIVDDLDQNRAMGVLSYAHREPDALLSDIVAGRHPGRTSAHQNTAYAPVGLPWQDLALGWLALQTATTRGIGTTVELTH